MVFLAGGNPVVQEALDSVIGPRNEVGDTFAIAALLMGRVEKLRRCLAAPSGLRRPQHVFQDGESFVDPALEVKASRPCSGSASGSAAGRRWPRGMLVLGAALPGIMARSGWCRGLRAGPLPCSGAMHVAPRSEQGWKSCSGHCYRAATLAGLTGLTTTDDVGWSLARGARHLSLHALHDKSVRCSRCLQAADSSQCARSCMRAQARRPVHVSDSEYATFSLSFRPSRGAFRVPSMRPWRACTSNVKRVLILMCVDARALLLATHRRMDLGELRT